MQLLVATRKAEADIGDSRRGNVTIKAKAATTNDKLVSLKQQVSDLVAVVKAQPCMTRPKRIHNKMTKGMTIKTEEPEHLGLMDILIAQDHQKIISQCNHWEPNLHGNIIIVGDGATWQKNVQHI